MEYLSGLTLHVPTLEKLAVGPAITGLTEENSGCNFLKWATPMMAWFMNSDNAVLFTV